MPTDLVQSLQIDASELPSEAVIFGSTAAMCEIRGQVERILHNDLPVLIRGERGTGKELIAKFLHTRSSRRLSPFIKVNCAEIPESLLESDLLGYVKGGSGGASAARRGLVELAAGGTLFLDEIGKMGWTLQSKLLHLLHDGQYPRSSDSKERKTRVRVICTTNSDLEKAVEQRAFREDLFYRIDVINLHLAPLRDRRQDIPQLCQHFCDKLARKTGKAVPPVTESTIQQLQQWKWPGNLRELENWVMRNVVLGKPEENVESGPELKEARPQASRHARNGHLKEVSRQAASSAATALILKVLQSNHFNRRKTAEALHMSYRSLLYKLHEAGVPGRRRSHKGPSPKS